MQHEKKLKPKKIVARDFGVVSRSVDRWVRDEDMHFPQPIKINGRDYFVSDQLEDWKIARIRASIGAMEAA